MDIGIAEVRKSEKNIGGGAESNIEGPNSALGGGGAEGHPKSIQIDISAEIMTYMSFHPVYSQTNSHISDVLKNVWPKAEKCIFMVLFNATTACKFLLALALHGPSPRFGPWWGKKRSPTSRKKTSVLCAQRDDADSTQI